jgi:hypothetical protein
MAPHQSVQKQSDQLNEMYPVCLLALLDYKIHRADAWPLCSWLGPRVSHIDVMHFFAF